jgi:hypothetical protein
MWVTLGESFHQRQRGRPPGGAHQGGQHRGVLAELDAPRLHVGTRGVDLEGRDLRDARQPLADLGVEVDLGAEDAREDRHPVRDARQLLAHEGFDADVLEADRVQHARRDLGDARRRVPVARLEGEALRHEAPEAAQVEEGLELEAVAEGPGSREHRVAQRDAREGDREVDLGRRHGSASKRSSPVAKTGPSRHTRA